MCNLSKPQLKMSATMRVFEKSATVLAFIQKISCWGEGKKERRKMNPKCNLLESEETTGILYASTIQFNMNSSKKTAR